MMATKIFQPPTRVDAINATWWESFDRDDVARIFAEDNGLDPSQWVAIGNRITDNLVRRMAYKKYGAINEKRRTFWPVFDMSNEEMRQLFRASGVRLTVDYEMFGRSFDGLNVRYLLPIKKRFPRDYQKILEWFPMADIEVFRYERNQLRHKRA